MAAPKPVPLLLLITIITMGLSKNVLGQASWCVARSDASNDALQTALDYACGSGGDCLPLQPDGLCFLPNTIQAHASYAFNSYYQRRARAPGSCDFAGTATIATSDPSIIYNFSLHFHFCFSVDQCDLIFILWICFCLCRLWILCVPFFCKVWPFSLFLILYCIILLLK